jgi:amidohydrolase
MARSTDPLLTALLAGIEHELAAAVELRRELHAHPELAHREHGTATKIEAALPVASRAVAGSGRVALIAGKGTPAATDEPRAPIAVRAELDGLAVEERTGAAFAASVGAMHACGHDVHMAALIALARAAHSLELELPAPLLAVFQPSEEAYPSGAELLTRETLSTPAPQAIVAAHVHPELAWGTVALDDGAVNASCDAFEIVVAGSPTHGAYPHLGRDPILAVSEIVVALHARSGRAVDPTQPASLSVGVLEGGSADNVIPGTARASGAIRAHRPADREALSAMLSEVANGVAAAHGCDCEVRLTAGEPALENDGAIAAAGRALLGQAGLAQATPPWRSCGSDDFAFFSALAPVAMAFVGLDGAAGFVSHPLHHPELLPPDEAVGAVARTQAVLYAAAASVIARSPGA